MSKMLQIEQAFSPKEKPAFGVGDNVDVHVLIREGDKERVQVFNGTVLRRNKGGLGATFTVRRIVQGEGVERTFPFHSPFVQKVEVKRAGRVRRSRLYYLRDRTGKATRIKEVADTRRDTEAAAAAARARAEAKPPIEAAAPVEAKATVEAKAPAKTPAKSPVKAPRKTKE